MHQLNGTVAIVKITKFLENPKADAINNNNSIAQLQL
jgi:hypothetical protein